MKLNEHTSYADLPQFSCRGSGDDIVCLAAVVAGDTAGCRKADNGRRIGPIILFEGG